MPVIHPQTSKSQEDFTLNPNAHQPTYRAGHAFFEPYKELPSSFPKFVSLPSARLYLGNVIRTISDTPRSHHTEPLPSGPTEDPPTPLLPSNRASTTSMGEASRLSFTAQALHGMDQPAIPAPEDYDEDLLPELTELNSAELAAMDNETLQKLIDQTEGNVSDSLPDNQEDPEAMTGQDDEERAITEGGKNPDGDANEPESMESTAELILIHTSLGMARNSFFDSIRLRHYLDAKKIRYYVVDMNKDWAVGHGLVDQQLLEAWNSAGLLYPDTLDNSKIMCPQVLIDGVAIGGYQDVQDMEEDDDLDWSLARKQCPACFHPRTLRDESCESCESLYQVLVNPQVEREGRVLVIQCGDVINNEEVMIQKLEGEQKQEAYRVDLEFA